MKDEPWRHDPGMRLQHLEEKLRNKKGRIRFLEERLNEVKQECADEESACVELEDTVSILQGQLEKRTERIAELEKERGTYKLRTKALEGLLVCHRTQRSVSTALWRRLEKSRDQIAALEKDSK